MGSGVVWESRLQFICDRQVNNRHPQFTLARTVS
jgi:hypothetical protein